MNVRELNAFYYKPVQDYQFKSGWTLYDPEREFERQLVLSGSNDWRNCKLNQEYQVSFQSKSDLKPLALSNISKSPVCS